MNRSPDIHADDSMVLAVAALVRAEQGGGSRGRVSGADAHTQHRRHQAARLPGNVARWRTRCATSGSGADRGAAFLSGAADRSGARGATHRRPGAAALRRSVAGAAFLLRAAV